MRRNLIQANFDGKPLMSGIPASFTWILITLLGAVTAPLCHPPSATTIEADPRPILVEARIAARGYDRNQRALPFTVYVLTRQLSWKLESADDLEGDGPLLTPDLVAEINGARDVFCVGTASFEGQVQAEEARGARRAGKLAEWVGSVIRDPAKTRLFRLNAGQYQGPRELASERQRLAILIVTRPHDDDVVLSEGLASGLKQQEQSSPIIYSLLHHYSRSTDWLTADLGKAAVRLGVVPFLPPRHQLMRASKL